jgi:hypothetical protein
MKMQNIMTKHNVVHVTSHSRSAGLKAMMTSDCNRRTNYAYAACRRHATGHKASACLYVLSNIVCQATQKRLMSLS